MNSPAHDVALLLVSAGLGSLGASSGWSINVGTQPTAPDTAITVYDTGGIGVDTDEMDLARESIQVRVRGRDYQAAYSKLEAVWVLLSRFDARELNGSWYVGFNPTSNALTLGRDDKNRENFTMNFNVLRQRNP